MAGEAPRSRGYMRLRLRRVPFGAQRSSATGERRAWMIVPRLRGDVRCAARATRRAPLRSRRW